MLSVRSLYAGYGDIDVLWDVSFDIGEGEFFTVIGANGCGKTTLLRAASAMLPYSGSIKLCGNEVSSLSRRQLGRLTSMLTQLSDAHFPFTVYDTVALGRYAHRSGLLSSLSSEDRKITEEMLRRMDLYDIRDRLITELSGGQLRRVFLARTLAQEPKLVMLDEPTNHLDLKYQLSLLDYLQEWISDTGSSVLGVLHDLNIVRTYSHRVMIMSEGRNILCGETSEALRSKELSEAYGVDIRAFMVDALEKWK